MSDAPRFIKIKAGCFFIFLILIFAFFLFFYRHQQMSEHVTLEDVLDVGEIIFITRNDAHCYYSYKDQPMGFEYDLAKAFADYLGVELKVNIIERYNDMFPALKKGAGAFIGANLPIMQEVEDHVAFSQGYMAVQLHVIVHRSNAGIQNIEDLNGKTIHIEKDSPYIRHVNALKEEGVDIDIRLHDLSAEELIRKVAENELEITVASSNIAMLNRRYYPQAIVVCPISEKEYLGWAVNRRSQNLLKRINSFLKTINSNGTFTEIYNRYYTDIEIFDYFDLSTFHKRLESRLPIYLDIITDAAHQQGFDWRLISAQMYQESHFDPKAKSRDGAFGLMQITKSIAKTMGIKDILDPKLNINAGVRHLKGLFDFFDKAKDPDRLYIALAAYNVGEGHILDARNLARKMNLDPDKWSSLSRTLPLLRDRQYYGDSIYGYCRGTEPVEYVKQIMIYYDILKRKKILNSPPTPPLFEKERG